MFSDNGFYATLNEKEQAFLNKLTNKYIDYLDATLAQRTLEEIKKGKQKTISCEEARAIFSK